MWLVLATQSTCTVKKKSKAGRKLSTLLGWTASSYLFHTKPLLCNGFLVVVFFSDPGENSEDFLQCYLDIHAGWMAPLHIQAGKSRSSWSWCHCSNAGSDHYLACTHWCLESKQNNVKSQQWMSLLKLLITDCCTSEDCMNLRLVYGITSTMRGSKQCFYTYSKEYVSF